MLREFAAELLRANKPISPSQFVQLTKESSSSGTRVIPVDGTWFLNPAVQSNGLSGYQLHVRERIPGARFFDIDAIKDENSPYPHMLPTKSKFDSSMSKLGLKNDDLLVVYDYLGNFSAPRAVWMLRAFQHKNSLLLDNYPSYKKEGYELENGEPSKVEETQYTSPGLDPEAVVSYEQIRELVCDQGKLDGINLIDARPEGRFLGTAPEPRPEISNGHAPGAVSVPFTSVTDSTTRQFKSVEELRKLLESKGVLDKISQRSTVVMCGTGVTACVVKSALELVQPDAKISIYDGSWTEFAQRADKSMIIK